MAAAVARLSRLGTAAARWVANNRHRITQWIAQNWSISQMENQLRRLLGIR